MLRPVPQPSSVIVIGEDVGRRVKACERREGTRRSSMDCRILPSVS